MWWDDVVGIHYDHQTKTNQNVLGAYARVLHTHKKKHTMMTPTALLGMVMVTERNGVNPVTVLLYSVDAVSVPRRAMTALVICSLCGGVIYSM